MIASLAMYDLPGLSPIWDRLWAGIRDALRDEGQEAPDTLTRDRSLWDVWQAPDLVLGQTCGLPFRSALQDRVDLLGSFDHGLPDTPPGHYHSVLVARTEDAGPLKDFAERRLAVNSFDSESGWAAAQATALANDFQFQSFVQTGAHLNSVSAVQTRQADIAAIDAVTWRLLERHMPGRVTGLEVIHRSRPTPGLPLIAVRDANTTSLCRAIRLGLTGLSVKDRLDLSLTGFVEIPKHAYLAVPLPPHPSPDQIRAAEPLLQSDAFPA